LQDNIITLTRCILVRGYNIKFTNKKLVPD
jgi:nitrous oxide reductase